MALQWRLLGAAALLILLYAAKETLALRDELAMADEPYTRPPTRAYVACAIGVFGYGLAAAHLAGELQPLMAIPRKVALTGSRDLRGLRTRALKLPTWQATAREE